MISIAVTNEAEFKKQVAAWFLEAKSNVAKAQAGVAREVFTNLVQRGPQYSGDYVKNINVSIGHVDTSFKETAVKIGKYGERVDAPKHEGHPDAVQAALSHGLPVLNSVKFGDTIYISSSAKHDEAYAFLIENGQIAFRDVNPSAKGGSYGFAVARAAAALKYARIDYSAMSKLVKGGLA